MANFDKPAFSWNQATKTFDPANVPLQRDELDIPAVTPGQLPAFRNAMDLFGGAAVTANQWGYPIVG